VQVVEAIPADDYRPAGPEQEYARQFQMKLWIDMAEAQIVRVESRVVGERAAIDQTLGLSWSGSSASPEFSTVKQRVEVTHGTVNDMEWTKVNDEAWLPARSYWKTAKMTIVGLSSKGKPLSFPTELTCTYSDYKKFRVDTRIVPQ
jgi:hypothetical protein